jgi:hypothetical protein
VGFPAVEFLRKCCSNLIDAHSHINKSTLTINHDRHRAKLIWIIRQHRDPHQFSCNMNFKQSIISNESFDLVLNRENLNFLHREVGFTSEDLFAFDSCVIHVYMPETRVTVGICIVVV